MGIVIGIIGMIGIIGGIGVMWWGKQNILGVISPLADDSEEKNRLRVIFDKKTTKDYPPNDNFPISLIPKFADQPDINATSFCAFDPESRQLLLAKNLTQELPIASVAKIMTAVVALDRASLNFDIKVSSQAASIGEAVMGLTSGEILTVEELLYGLMLPSGNDAAEALAGNIAGGRNSFLKAMNDKAQELGMWDSFFFNPSGLDGETRDKTSFSTCLDLLGLTSFALKDPEFAEIVSTYEKILPYTAGRHKAYYLYNILDLDRSYPGIKGVKPGITDFAKETLVSYIEKDGKKIIVVLLGTENSKDEVIKLYDFLFPLLGVKIK